jgi:hypothetical protein
MTFTLTIGHHLNLSPLSPHSFLESPAYLWIADESDFEVATNLVHKLKLKICPDKAVEFSAEPAKRESQIYGKTWRQDYRCQKEFEFPPGVDGYFAAIEGWLRSLTM